VVCRGTQVTRSRVDGTGRFVMGSASHLEISFVVRLSTMVESWLIDETSGEPSQLKTIDSGGAGLRGHRWVNSSPYVPGGGVPAPPSDTFAYLSTGPRTC